MNIGVEERGKPGGGGGKKSIEQIFSYLKDIAGGHSGENPEGDVKMMQWNVKEGDMASQQFTGEVPTEEQDIVKALVDMMNESKEASEGIPEDIEYWNTFPEFRRKAKKCGKYVLQLVKKFMEHCDPESDFDYGEDGDYLADPGVYEHILDVIDGLMDDVEDFLQDSKRHNDDQESSRIRGQLRSTADSAREQGKRYATMLSNVQDIPKPQKQLNWKIENSRDLPFKPHLEIKYHSLGESQEGRHPYEKEIKEFVPPEEMFVRPVKEEKPLVSIQNAAKYIDTLDVFEDFIQELRTLDVRELAVDLEAHSARSFQISTRQSDFLVDTIALRSEIHRLGEFFSDPTVVKVFHGADWDIGWLQRDFSVYVVNLFDTFQAAKSLRFQTLSYAYLLEKYCHVTSDKKLQLADWRVRPLSSEMLYYAQQLRKALLDFSGDALTGVINASRWVSLKIYKKPGFSRKGYLEKLSKKSITLDDIDKKVLEALWDWRDLTARAEDESCGYILTWTQMLRIARNKPISHQRLTTCGNPLSPVVLQRSGEILKMVADVLREFHMSQEDLSSNSLEEEASFRQHLDRVTSPSPSPFSPLPSTDELYQLAGWIREGEKDELNEEDRVEEEEEGEELLLDDGLRGRSNLKRLMDKDLLTMKGRENADASVSARVGEGGSSGDCSVQMSPLARCVVSRSKSTGNQDETLTVYENLYQNAHGGFQTEPEVRGPSDVHGAEEKANGEVRPEVADPEDIPRSMKEIYQISNRNRKRNKEKKKLRENSTEKSSNDGSKNGEQIVDAEKRDRIPYFSWRKKQKNEGEDDSETLDFMSEVGWLSQKEKERIGKLQVQKQLHQAERDLGGVPGAGTSQGVSGSAGEGGNRSSGRRKIVGRRGSSPGKRNQGRHHHQQQNHQVQQSYLQSQDLDQERTHTPSYRDFSQVLPSMSNFQNESSSFRNPYVVQNPPVRQVRNSENSYLSKAQMDPGKTFTSRNEGKDKAKQFSYKGSQWK